MKHGIAPRNGVSDGRLIPKIGLDEINFGDVSEGFEPPRRQIVEADDGVTLGDQPATQMRSDEACGAGDEDLHNRTTFRRVPRVTPRASNTSEASRRTPSKSTTECAVRATTQSC